MGQTQLTLKSAKKEGPVKESEKEWYEKLENRRETVSENTEEMLMLSKLSGDQVRLGLNIEWCPSDRIIERVLVALTRVISKERWKQNMG